MNRKNEIITITDRLALGFGSGVIAFITGTILWLIFHLIFTKATQLFGAIIPFYFVWVFTSFNFLLGALTLEDYVLKIVVPIWQAIYKIWKYIFGSLTTPN